MNILFLTPRLPLPPIKGDRLRSLYFIKELSKTNTIHLISFIESIDEKNYIPALMKYCKKVDVVCLPRWKSTLNMLTNISLKKPFQVSYYYSKEMRQLVKDAVKSDRYDLVHMVLLRMVPYIEDVNGIPVVLDHIDCLSLNMERRFRTERSPLRKKLFEIEYKMVKECESMFRGVPSVVTSENDRRALNGYKVIKVISNGVDLERFTYTNEDKVEKDIDLIFVGNMGYFPNVQAIEFFFNKVYPIIKRYKKDISLYIVGVNPPKNIKSLTNNQNIFVTGFVEDVREYLYRSKVFIAPLQSGSGIQNKILEAMACGVPVVSTSIGNSGIGAENKKEILIADDPNTFSEMVIALLEDNERRRKLSLNARQFVEHGFSWAKKSKEIESFYQEITDEYRSTLSY